MTSPRSSPHPMYPLCLLFFICSSSLLAIAISPPPPPPNIPLQPLPPCHSPGPYYNAYPSDISAYNRYSTPPQGYKGFNPSMAIVIIVLLGAFFFMGFFSVYVRRCSTDRELDTSFHHHPHAGEGDDEYDQHHPQFYLGGNSSSINGHLSDDENGFSRHALSQGGGIDTNGLPSLLYTKAANPNKTAECVVCLGEFQEGDALHLLPKCGHFFHQDCIDMWLFSHTTCPLCRRSPLLFDKGVVSASSPWRNPIPQANSLENPTQDVDRDLQNYRPQEHRDSQNPGQQTTAPHRPFAATELGNPSTEEMQASTLSEQSQGVQSSLATAPPHPAAKSNLNPALTRSHSTGHSLIAAAAAAGGSQTPRISSPATPIFAVRTPPLSSAAARIGHRSRSHTTLSNLQTYRHPEEQDAEDRCRGDELQSATRDGWSFLSGSSRSEAPWCSDQYMVSSSTRIRTLVGTVCRSGPPERDDIVHLARVL